VFLRPNLPFLGTVLVGTALVTGCRSVPKQEASLLLFPPPPDRPRIQFLTWASGAEQVAPPRNSFEEFILGEEPAEYRRINKPYGVAARDGVVYVCDTKDLCVVRMDFKNGSYTTLGTRGPGRLRKPINIAIDPLGYKFVVDPVRKQLVVFDPSDGYVTAFDMPEPCHPVDVAIYEDELYVLDNDDTCQVVVLGRETGEVLRTFGEPGGEPGQFRIPNSLCVDADGYVYVSDTHNWRIQKLTRDGEPVWVRGMPGYLLGQFGRPRGIRAGPNDVIYLVDGATEIVQMFDTDGRKLMRFGGPGDVPGALVLPSSLAIDSTSIPYFEKYAHPDFDVEYLLFVASQFGDHLVSVYAFGSFPEGYQIAESQIARLPGIPMEEGIGPVERQPTTDESQRDEQAPESDQPGQIDDSSEESS
jgi:sugar lactone lactonase YvrE